MKSLLIGAVVLVSASAPATSNATVENHGPYHIHNIQSVRDAYGTVTPRPHWSAEEVDCQDPNVVTVDECRVSSNGQ